MAATINETSRIEAAAPILTQENEASEATRLARFCTLEELPGLVFGILTVAYIVLSLSGLVL
jgi:hypothetical protein